ncbi:MAG: hypothetical protein HZB56_14760 [Deltaproteobacteria bacterium]|nr:hypothetical protein [Deltaproteobacteria bacterium]
MPESHSRRTYLIDRRFQLKYVLLLMGWGAVMAVLFGLWAWQAHQQAAELLARDADQQALLHQADRTLLVALAAIGLLSMLALGLLGFIITHRVAGPVWVMGLELAELARGRYPARRGLRRGDELQSLHTRFHQAIDALAARDRHTLEALEEVLGSLRSAAGRSPELQPAVAALEIEVKARREGLGGEHQSAPPAG